MKKYDLNDDLETVADLYTNNETKELGVYLAANDLTLDDETHDGMITLTLKKNVEITAPLLSNVLGKNYEIETSKVLYENYDGLNGE